MEVSRDPDFCVVGAGPAGAFLAALVGARGWRALVVDKRPDPREHRIEEQRSINITLSERGLAALDRIGMRDALLARSVPLYGRVIHYADGSSYFDPYGARNEAIHSINRADLTRALVVRAAEQPSVALAFQTSCEAVRPLEGRIRLRSADGTARDLAPRRLIGADGAFSRVRRAMQSLPHFDFSQLYAPREYREIVLRPPASSAWATPRNAVHLWPRGDFMLIGFPNTDGTITLSLQLPREGPRSHAACNTREALADLFREHFPDVCDDFLAASVDDYLGRPLGRMVTIRCRPWSCGDRTLLVGDAAHSIFPSYGQGCNASFEDLVCLVDLLAGGAPWTEVVARFEAARRPQAEAIARLSIEHFELLDAHAASDEYRRRSMISRAITASRPSLGSTYHTVSFTRVSYTEAIDVGRSHERAIDRVLELLGPEQDEQTLSRAVDAALAEQEESSKVAVPAEQDGR